MAHRLIPGVIVGVFGRTDLKTSCKEVAIGFEWRGRRRAWRICVLPWTRKKVEWSELVYDRGLREAN